METLRYVVLVNALLTVVSLAYYVLLRRETFFRTNRLVLWMGILATLLLPLLELPDWRPQPVRTVMHRTAQVIVPKILSRVGPSKPEVTITFPNQRTYPAFQNRSTSFRWSWPMLVLLVYVGVALVLFIRLGVQLNSLRRLIRQSVHESYGDFTMVRNEQVTSPFSFFDWVVLNPDRHASDELEQILRHERVHVRERHSLDMLGAELVCIVFWFNPAAYLFRFLLHQTLEFSADQTVLAEGVDVRAYQYNLVKVSLSAGQSAITNYFSKSQLISRIRMLNQPVSTGCQIGPVDEKYPERLRELAIQERSSSLPDVLPAGNTFSDANSVFGLYRVFFRNDFLESNYFKYRQTAIRMTPDYHLDLYPEYQNAVIFIDGREVDRTELGTFEALDLKKVVVFEGKAAVLRLGDSRAKNGLILLSRLHNIAIRDRYASTRLLDRAYPELFAQP